MEEKKGLTIKGLLIRGVLVVAFIFLLVWLFPMPDLKPLNNQIFADNIDRMKDAAKSYYTVERLPDELNESHKMTLKEMIDKKLILPLMDSNGKYCSNDKSYVEITKLENEYIIKIYLSFTDKEDYIIEHYGCYDICSDKCIATTPTTNKVATTIKKKGVVNQVNKTIYEYEYVKNTCSQIFVGNKCKSGYKLSGSDCVKTGSNVVSKPAISKVTTESKPAVKQEITSTINATKTNVEVSKVVKSIQKITANKNYTYDVKGAVGTTTKTYANYVTQNSYDVISATKYVSAYKWTYVSTLTSLNSGLAFTSDTEKLVLVDSWEELTCTTCFTTQRVYKYYRYKKEAKTYGYTCEGFSGYTLYDTNKCRKLITGTKVCPAGYNDTGKECVSSKTTYSCAKYGSDYKLDESKKTCTKTTVKYSCPAGSTADKDPKYCLRNVYGCPNGSTESNGKCLVTKNTCPANTSTTTYTLSGDKCIVKTTGLSCSKYGSDYKLNGNNCVSSKTSLECADKGYTLSGDTCYKTVNSSDVIKATPTYKTVCKTEKKWSTKTSIEGWTYTGNKNKLN